MATAAIVIRIISVVAIIGEIAFLLFNKDKRKKDEFVTISRVGTGLTDEEFRTVNKLAEKSRVSHNLRV